MVGWRRVDVMRWQSGVFHDVYFFSLFFTSDGGRGPRCASIVIFR